jgi:hypothetical protein
MSFPTSKSLQCKFWFKGAASCVDRGAFGAYAQAEQREKALKRTMRACGWVYPRACVKKSGKKFRIDFSPISDELAGMQVG